MGSTILYRIPRKVGLSGLCPIAALLQMDANKLITLLLLTNKTTGHIFTPMSKRESKKDLILCRGLDVMKSQGYNGTSVKDIVDAAGVPKGSFYNYFDSKETFAIEALNKVASESIAASQPVLSDSSVPALERVQRYFKMGAEMACSGEYKVGCFLGNMCQEMSDNNEAIRVKLRQILKRKTSMIAEVLEQAKAQGQFDCSIESEIMAEFLFNAWEGALMRMKASKCREPLDAFLTMLDHITT